MTLTDLEAEALKLRPDARAKLAASLLHSLEDLKEEEIEELWLDEAERRNREIEEGTLSEIPAEEVFREVRARLL
ncbi:MAG TPA: addiction module protein [Thermoanaerobaculia bacterium]|nr:addiction module protein [Thermoanaerobaculia bacterium]